MEDESRTPCRGCTFLVLCPPAASPATPLPLFSSFSLPAISLRERTPFSSCHRFFFFLFCFSFGMLIPWIFPWLPSVYRFEMSARRGLSWPPDYPLIDTIPLSCFIFQSVCHCLKLCCFVVSVFVFIFLTKTWAPASGGGLFSAPMCLQCLGECWAQLGAQWQFVEWMNEWMNVILIHTQGHSIHTCTNSFK